MTNLKIFCYSFTVIFVRILADISEMRDLCKLKQILQQNWKRLIASQIEKPSASQACGPKPAVLRTATEISFSQKCAYTLKRKKKHDLESKALTGLFATTPPNGNESKIFSCTSLKDIPIALITTDLLLTQSADLSQC